mgnify:CR=1 FL=1
MHVKAKQMAFGGLILAVTVVCMALGSVIETNTLFLLAAAAFFVGIVIREFGLRTGAAFYLAAILLGFLVTPNKFYVITFAAMGFYILGIEAVWIFLAKRPQMGHRMGIYWLVKYGVSPVSFRIPLDAVSESSVRSIAFGSCNGWADSNIGL